MPAAGVLAEHRVVDLDHHVDRGGVPPGGQRRRYVHEADPQPVAEPGAEPPGLVDQVQQELVDGAEPHRGGPRQVHAEQVVPE